MLKNFSKPHFLKDKVCNLKQGIGITEVNNTDRSELRKKAMSLPLCPGVYFMKDKNGKIIYIGKAKKLKNRVSSYFGSDKQHTLKVKKMVEQVDDFEYILCDSEFEALILECSSIKQHSPKYNILLKDDKGYHYIKITNGDWPVIKEVKKKLNDNAIYIGPYNSGWILKQTIDEARKIYKLPDCSKKFPQDFGKERPCLNYHIGICSAPCTGKIKKKDYYESVQSAARFIKSGSARTAEEMEIQMRQAAERLDFETAAKLRDRIRALNRSRDRQKVISSSYKEQDIIAAARTADSVCFAVMKFRGGHLSDLSFYVTGEDGELKSDRTEFLERYYSMQNEIPPRIVLDGEIFNFELICEFLKSKAQKNVNLVIPQKGNQFELVKMCEFNAAEHLSKLKQRETSKTAALDELARLLGLSQPPVYIEAYDISNTAGSENVAGMTVFENGRPLKSAYKKFRIKTFSGQDDFKSMAEVLDRRFTEYENAAAAGKTDGFGRLPDLILLDGGLGQLHAVLPTAKKHNINTPIFGMVKDSKHKTRAIAADGGNISIKANRRAYTLVSTIQEETHRFAITYHHARSTKQGLSSELCKIDGVGPARAKLLIKEFKTISALRSATAEQIMQRTNIPAEVCKNIAAFYNE